MKTINIYSPTDNTIYVIVEYATNQYGMVTHAKIVGGSGKISLQNELMQQVSKYLCVAVQEEILKLIRFEIECDRMEVRGFTESKADFTAFETQPLREWCNF